MLACGVNNCVLGFFLYERVAMDWVVRRKLVFIKLWIIWSKRLKGILIGASGNASHLVG